MRCRYVPAGVRQVFSGSAGMWPSERPQALNFGGPNFDIEDYELVNFATEYEINPHMSIFGRIDNLTNEHYAEVFGFPSLGRGAFGGVKVRF